MEGKIVFRMRKSLEENLAEFEKEDGAKLPSEIKEAIKSLDEKIRKLKDVEDVTRSLRALLMCIMYWTAIRHKERSEEITKDVKEGEVAEAYKALHKLYIFAVETLLYISEMIMYSDRCIEILVTDD